MERQWSDEQKAIFEWFAGKTSVRNLVVRARAGCGKCLGRGTPVLMFDGSIKPVEQIIKGDRLMGPDSKPRRVLSTNVGVSALRRIVPVKGEPWVCNDVHVMTLMGTNHSFGEIIDVPINELPTGWRRKWKLWRTGADWPTRKVPVDPYLLGLWIGDGTFGAAEITNSDPPILEYCAAIAPVYGAELVLRRDERCNTFNLRFRIGPRGKAGRHTPHFLLRFFKSCVDTTRKKKQIPQEYLVNDREVRRALLAGILDTDGYLRQRGFEVTSVHRHLAEQYAFIARSLGFSAYVRKHRGSIKSIGFVGTYWRVAMSGDFTTLPLRVHAPQRRRQVKRVNVTGFKVKPAGRGTYFGFTLDGDGRFLLGDFTVTHNTSSILEAINHAPERRILLAAFNKIIAEELQGRMRNPRAEAKTLHALGFSFVRQAWPKLKVDGRRKWTLAKAVTPRHAPQSVLRIVAELHTKAREILPHVVESPESAIDALCELALEHELTLGEEEIEAGFTDTKVAGWAFDAMIAAMARTDAIDFADMIFLPIVHKWIAPRYDLVVVDEAQDMSGPQLELAQKACTKGGRIAVIGDDRQCQPPGTMVRVPGGREVPIESLKDGDFVVAWDRQSKSLVGRTEHIYPVRVAKRRVRAGELIAVRAGARTTRCTPTHLWAVKLGDRSTTQWVTYLMRRGDDYRVGWCQLFNKSGALHLGQRTRLDRAGAAWILSVHSSKAAASMHESLIATRFGLPLVQFAQSVASPNAGFITQKYLDDFWCAVRGQQELRASARICLEAYGRDHAHPFYVTPKQTRYKRGGRTTVMVLAACNLLPGMCVPVPISARKSTVKWTPIKITREPYDGLVYSLEVRKHPYYVADGIVTHNCIYGFRGADQGSFERLKGELDALELGLKTTYRCPQGVVELAAQIVPDFVAAPTAPAGIVRRCDDPKDTLVRDAQPGDFVLSRTNAPLVPLCLALLKAGKLARVRGRDLSVGLRALVATLQARGAKDMDDLRIELRSHLEREVAKLNKRGEKGQLDPNAVEAAIERAADHCAVIAALTEGLVSFDELYARFDTLFTGDDNAATVMFSTVHRAKGLESERVWLLTQTFLATKRDKMFDESAKWRRGAEEQNIRYVAITRSKHELVWLHGDYE